MADQKRWFKVWTSLIVDMDHLPLATIGAFVKLGCRIALVGDKGTTTFEGWEHLARFLGVDQRTAREHLDALRSIHVDPPPNRYGAFAVTFRNWHKYQEDSTAAQRMKTLRSKKRREEIRRETPISQLDSHTGQHKNCRACGTNPRAQHARPLEPDPGQAERRSAEGTPDPFDDPEAHALGLAHIRNVKALLEDPRRERHPDPETVAQILAGARNNGHPDYP